LTGNSLGTHRPRDPAAGRAAWSVELLRLGELVDAALQELLIGAQIGQLVGVCPRKTRQQSNCRSHAA